MKYRFVLLLISLLVTQIILAQSVTVSKGSGSFIIEGSAKHQKDSIAVFYHMPESFNQSSKILMVIPGAGRNADDYRDSWVEASEEYRLLIVSPSYPEKDYNYGDYHLGGIVKDLNLSKGVYFKKGTNQVHIDEDIIEFNITDDKEDWIFSDFDRIFELVKKTTKSKQKKYDMFGHSAGGQILHRFVLFQANSKADRILASNAGTYTLADYTTNYPFGMKNVGIDQKALGKSFKKRLVLFLGELDNDAETRGKMLRSVTADKQGTNRLDRGENFYDKSADLSEDLNMKFNWKLEVIPNVGHDQKEMAKAASAYLYGQD